LAVLISINASTDPTHRLLVWLLGPIISPLQQRD
jgi:hypothetical protein